MMSEEAGFAFELDIRLKADTVFVASLELSDLLLMNNCAVPWLILVPRKAGCVELTDLHEADQTRLFNEINVLHVVLGQFKPDKINTGALGNVVSQLHIHVIGRYKSDPVWPAPVWGQLPPKPYNEKELEAKLLLIRAKLGELTTLVS